ncbi:MAG: hypothetical protein AAF222_16030 [Pseudomonadota bacterium]
MSNVLSAFTPVPEQTNLWSAQKGNLRCTALKLRDGSFCLYSPVLGLGEETKASLAAQGEVSYLLAPNHYHHKGLKEFAEAFPKAKLVCSERAQPRLAKQTGLDSDSLQLLQPHLPEGYSIAEPQGLKTGEVWLVGQTPSDLLWVVCDSFKGPSGPVGSIGTSVEMLGTFPIYGIKDGDVYAAWVAAQLATGAPSMIVPCHGAMVRNTELAPDILALLRP